MKTPLAGLVTVLLAAAAAVAPAQDVVRPPKPTDPPVGGEAKDFTAVDVLNARSSKTPFTALQGRVVLFVAFVAGDKPAHKPCIDTIADLNALHDKFGPKGLTVLAYSEQDRATVEAYIAEKRVKFGWALIDKPTGEQFKTEWPGPAPPWAFLVDAAGKIVWQGRPIDLPRDKLEPLFLATRVPPVLPKALEAHQKPLDDGQWGAAFLALRAAAQDAKLERIERTWAASAADWIQMRHDQWMGEVDALCKEGWWWEARNLANEYTTRFAGMEGGELGKARADEISAKREATFDLALGDSVAKARAFIDQKKYGQAKMILNRVMREGKGTRHAPRAEKYLRTIPSEKTE